MKTLLLAIAAFGSLSGCAGLNTNDQGNTAAHEEREYTTGSRLAHRKNSSDQVAHATPEQMEEMRRQMEVGAQAHAK